MITLLKRKAAVAALTVSAVIIAMQWLLPAWLDFIFDMMLFAILAWATSDERKGKRGG